MSEIVDEIVGTKPRRRAVAKSTTPVVEPRRGNQVRLRDKEFEALSVHAIKTKRTKAEIVEELIRTHLKRFVVQDRGGAGGGNPTGEARASVETLPMIESVTSSDADSGTPTAGEGEGAPLPRRKRA